MNATTLAAGKTVATTRPAPYSLRTTARIAGLLYLVIIVAGLFAQFFVRDSLIVAGDAAATAGNVLASEGLFRAGIAADLVMVIADVGIAIAFYILLKPVSNTLALLAAFFRLAQGATLGINLLNLVFGLQLLNGADYLAVIGVEQQQALALSFFNAHSAGYTIGLVFFGVSIFILGYLLTRSGYFPRILGILLVVASLAYLADGFAQVLLPNYVDFQAIFANVVLIPAFIAELALCLWLLIKGVNVRPAETAAAPA